MTEIDLIRAMEEDRTEQQRFKPHCKEYTPDFFTAMGRIGGIDWRGDTKALRALGVNPDTPIKKACQRRLSMMFENSYRNIEI